MTKAGIDEETRAFYEQIVRLLAENNALLKSNHAILEGLNENVRKIRFNTN